MPNPARTLQSTNAPKYECPEAYVTVIHEAYVTVIHGTYVVVKWNDTKRNDINGFAIPGDRYETSRNGTALAATTL